MQSRRASPPHAPWRRPSGPGVDGWKTAPAGSPGRRSLRPFLRFHLPPVPHPPAASPRCPRPPHSPRRAHRQPLEKLTVCRPLSARGPARRVPEAGWVRGEAAQRRGRRRRGNVSSTSAGRSAALSVSRTRDAPALSAQRYRARGVRGGVGGGWLPCSERSGRPVEQAEERLPEAPEPPS